MVLASAWPRRSATVRASIPAPISWVAVKCRRSWKVRVSPSFFPKTAESFGQAVRPHGLVSARQRAQDVAVIGDLDTGPMRPPFDSGSMSGEDLKAGRVECDAPGPAGLGRADLQHTLIYAVADGLAEMDDAGLDVHVRPAEPT